MQDKVARAMIEKLQESITSLNKALGFPKAEYLPLTKQWIYIDPISIDSIKHDMKLLLKLADYLGLEWREELVKSGWVKKKKG